MGNGSGKPPVIVAVAVAELPPSDVLVELEQDKPSPVAVLVVVVVVTPPSDVVVVLVVPVNDKSSHTFVAVVVLVVVVVVVVTPPVEFVAVVPVTLLISKNAPHVGAVMVSKPEAVVTPPIWLIIG